jgi:hypothetical protein
MTLEEVRRMSADESVFICAISIGLPLDRCRVVMTEWQKLSAKSADADMREREARVFACALSVTQLEHGATACSDFVRAWRKLCLPKTAQQGG